MVSANSIMRLVRCVNVVDRVVLTPSINAPLYYCILDEGGMTTAITVKASRLNDVLAYLRENVSLGRAFKYKQQNVKGMQVWNYTDGVYKIKIVKVTNTPVR